ncbi:hypothetical protein [Flaviaesturariibacter aridisoli]|uniref:Multi-ubiquitin domain-containing protein n=1 Tax=Flaviaesturariibacter aridisoli TaxID=2545761 RepID=A0A4R4DRM1_9BACT|nr:hypothetical protein [Flaviaesturariibacter aridisoli]TCZ65032.1 hypothetical protein E0486_17850 [Flaviaesturariibacter aridisoli]
MNDGKKNEAANGPDAGKKKYKFKIENEVHEWPKQHITGAEVRAVPPGIPENMDLFVKEKGKVGRLVKADDSFDLDESSGIDKFYSQESKSTPGKA